MSKCAADIAALAAELAGVPRARIDRDDLLASPGLDGRAASRFLQIYAGRFGVDMRGYRWWFHHRDHGVLAMPLVALDGERHEIRIPLSAEMLARFAERGRWDEYMAAYEDMIRATSRPGAPWYVVPADNKWFARLTVARAMIETLDGLDLEFPSIRGAALAELHKVRAALLREGRRGRAGARKRR